jgi:hypothetical protein
MIVGERIPSRRPMLSSMSSLSPRQFISQPRFQAVGAGTCQRRAESLSRVPESMAKEEV